MKVVEDNTERTVLMFHPPKTVPLGVTLGFTFFCGAGWWTTSSGKWLAASVFCVALTVMVVLALCFNRRTLTFDWQRLHVDGLLHNWNPLFKDEVEHHTLKDVKQWIFGQERNAPKDRTIAKVSSIWQIGLERARR